MGGWITGVGRREAQVGGLLWGGAEMGPQFRTEKGPQAKLQPRRDVCVKGQLEVV